MEIVFLGTGTGVPRADRGSPGLLFVAGETVILVDSGAGTLRQLDRVGRSYNDLDFILYTHFHPDHTADLAPYLFATRYWPRFTRTEPARIYGPEGLLDLDKNLRQTWGQWVEPPDNLVVFSELPVRESFEFVCGGVMVESGPIPHTPESLGYRITEPGGSTVVVTGDTDYGPELVELAHGADLLITECSFPEGEKREGHLIPSLAGRAAREAGVKALALTHFYPEAENHDLVTDAAREFSGPITLAHDLLALSV
jgi:ribonuclease BN (tRNA processing enzyme)